MESLLIVVPNVLTIIFAASTKLIVLSGLNVPSGYPFKIPFFFA